MKLKTFIGKVDDAEQILPMESDEFYLLPFNRILFATLDYYLNQ